jgi:2-oxoglutarate dehydrogenase E1 component
MEGSLAVPTATSVREIPAKLLLDNRDMVNKALARSGAGKVSVTHLIAFAVVHAARQVPRLNVRYTTDQGRPAVEDPGQINLGIAVDLIRPDGSRQLLVPNIKGCQEMDFARFRDAYQEVLGRTRAGQLTVADLTGTTLTVTNPGTLGTRHSVPRLLAGQGAIIGVGALAYPAAFAGTAPETLARLGIGRTVTVTSTYDHRIIQGAESGEFLRRVEAALLGEDGFYDLVFRSLRIPYQPLRWVQDIPADHRDQVGPATRVQELVHAYRVRGHLAADTNPLEYRQRQHPDLDIAEYGLTLWDLDRSFPTGGFGGRPQMSLREILAVLQDSYCRTVGVEYQHIQDPGERRWLQERWRSPPRPWTPPNGNAS